MFETVAAMLGGSFQRAPWGWGVLAMLVLGYFKLKPLLIRLKNERESNLLSERAEEMEAMRERIGALETKLETERAEREAERSVDRHRINNLTACLDALLLMIEQAPSKAGEAAKRIKAMRADQMKIEADEKAAIHAARIAAASTGTT